MTAKLTWTTEEVDALIEAIDARLTERINERRTAYVEAEAAVEEAERKAQEALVEFNAELDRQGLALDDVEAPGEEALCQMPPIPTFDWHTLLGHVLAGLAEDESEQV